VCVRACARSQDVAPEYCCQVDKQCYRGGCVSDVNEHRRWLIGVIVGSWIGVAAAAGLLLWTLWYCHDVQPNGGLLPGTSRFKPNAQLMCMLVTLSGVLALPIAWGVWIVLSLAFVRPAAAGARAGEEGVGVVGDAEGGVVDAGDVQASVGSSVHA
jgi:cobalamin synthase